MPTPHDTRILRDLASRVADIASLSRQEDTRALWRALNGRRPQRPMVMIDQVCWHEMNIDGELTLSCTDPECRRYEDQLRRTLFQWRHFPVDMVVEPFLRVYKASSNTWFDMHVQEDTAVSDPNNPVVGHKFTNQLISDEDIEKLVIPPVHHDTDETERRLAVAHELFDGIMEVRLSGIDPYFSLWDPLSTWMGVEDALYTIVDRPEFMHRILERMTTQYLALLDELESQGLLCEPQSLVHCTGAWTDELPAPGYDPDRPRAKDIWTFGLAQMLATVSPDMFQELEVDYVARIFDRFGMVYYGCCDPLDGKMDQVRRIPHVRKVSMSPWANQEHGAAEIASDYVFSRKPNPALLATSSFDVDAVRNDLLATKRICDDHGCPLEFILKDISTVAYQPQRLFQWAETAMQVACG